MQAITFLIGLALIVVGIFGGGIEVKEIKIPTLPTLPRILSSMVGLVLIVVCLAFPQLLLGPQTPSSAIPSVASTDDKSKLFLGAAIQNHIATIRDVKMILRHVGKYSGPINDEVTDQYFQSVADFQTAQKIQIDGLVGPETYAKLREAWPEFFSQASLPEAAKPAVK
jgi:hypothetical protein